METRLRGWRFVGVVIGLFVILFVGNLFLCISNIGAEEITRVSVNSGGVQGDSVSICPSISSDGRFVAFVSFACNLVSEGCNGFSQVFVHNRQTGETTVVSKAPNGDLGNYNSMGSDNLPGPAISQDGRFVAFYSLASNLVNGDTNNENDVFVHDRQTGETTRVSVSSNGIEGNGSSRYPAINTDGRFIAFVSDATNLVGEDTHGFQNVFLHDRVTAQTILVSKKCDGCFGSYAVGISSYPSISSDGTYIAFASNACNLVESDYEGNCEIADIFIYDQQVGQNFLVSLSSSGSYTNGISNRPSVSGDGRFVAFESAATNLVSGDTNGLSDIFVRDRQTGQNTRVSVYSYNGAQGNGNSNEPRISADGRFVTFHSLATNLVDGDTQGLRDVFVHNRETGNTILISVDNLRNQGNGSSGFPTISGEGQYIAFHSYATNLVPQDTNASTDAFVHRLSSVINGFVQGISVVKGICRNLTTRETVIIENPTRNWDCGAAGLNMNPGDAIDIILKGTAE